MTARPEEAVWTPARSRADAQRHPRFAAYAAAARDAAPDGRPAVCEFEHARGRPPREVFQVGPVLMAGAVLACADHLAAAVQRLAAALPRAAVTRTIPVKELEP